MAYEEGMTIAFDLLSGMAVVSFRGDIVMLGPFANERLARKAGERFCRDRGWEDEAP
jgi:hypothetical protein